MSLAATSTVTEVSSRVAPESSLATGALLTTVTVAPTVPKLPAESLTLNVTVVTPRGKTSGPSFSIPVSSPSSRSVAVAPARKAAMARLDWGVPKISRAATVMLLGAVITGSLASTTVTVAVAVPKLRAESRTLKVTVVVTPRG